MLDCWGFPQQGRAWTEWVIYSLATLQIAWGEALTLATKSNIQTEVKWGAEASVSAKRTRDSVSNFLSELTNPEVNKHAVKDGCGVPAVPLLGR